MITSVLPNAVSVCSTRCSIFHLMASFYCILKHFYFYSNICQKTWIVSIQPSDFYKGPNGVFLRCALCSLSAFLPRYPPVDCNHILLVFYTSFVSYQGENNHFHLVLVNRFRGNSANFILIIYNNLSVSETPKMRWTDVQGWLSHYIKFFLIKQPPDRTHQLLYTPVEHSTSTSSNQC